MDTISLRIELPAYEHSFELSIHPNSTIRQVKEEISLLCPGQPRADGQRLIARGRILGDEQRIADIWTSSSDSRILHLAVHPSAWTTDPPPLPPLPIVASPITDPAPYDPASSVAAHSLDNLVRPLRRYTPEAPVPLRTTNAADHKPLPYIVLLHKNALEALKSSHPQPIPTWHADLRSATVAAVKALGWEWPTILDTPYPEYSTDPGLKYDAVGIHGHPYLKLQNPNARPNRVQSHALHVLSYTFTLLEVRLLSATISRTLPGITIPRGGRIDQLLRQHGMAALHARPAGNGVQMRDLPLRPLLMPIAMLLFRAVLLLYFVGPAHKPVLGVVVLAWLLYELWQPVRNLVIAGAGGVPPGLNADNNPQPNIQLQPPADLPGPNANIPNVPNDNRAQFPPPAQNRPAFGAQGPAPGHIEFRWEFEFRFASILDSLADLNLQAEQQILNQADQVPTPEPTLGHKVLSFLGLFIGTLHPALWNRRRAALRRREGPIRTEANSRQRPDPTPEEATEEQGDDEARAAQQIENNQAMQARDELRAKHARRPQWVQRYIERVVAEEWVDDLD
ncbi:hypothetical protein BKA70DRAFT_1258594 [Coprinopsis sp. MPI-PUGE-AT-0042]|nr:hypothetical protein BKA70DRAFT_1258594 [Coprinopsis sp. MPI-PUGE-AT-0042]